MRNSLVLFFTLTFTICHFFRWPMVILFTLVALIADGFIAALVTGFLTYVLNWIITCGSLLAIYFASADAYMKLSRKLAP